MLTSIRSEIRDGSLKFQMIELYAFICSEEARKKNQDSHGCRTKKSCGVLPSACLSLAGKEQDIQRPAIQNPVDKRRSDWFVILTQIIDVQRVAFDSMACQPRRFALLACAPP